MLKVLAVTFPVAFLIPFLTGICFQVAVVSALRIADYQTALFFPWQHWAMGILQWKIFCVLVTMGPDWWMKAVFERVLFPTLAFD